MFFDEQGSLKCDPDGVRYIAKKEIGAGPKWNRADIIILYFFRMTQSIRNQ